MRDDILDLLWEFVQDEQNAVLISSHITSDLEKVADYIVFLHQGRVVFEKPKDELRYGWGMLRCGEARLRTLDPADIVAWRRQDYECEVLVCDRDAARKKYPRRADRPPPTIDGNHAHAHQGGKAMKGLLLKDYYLIRDGMVILLLTFVAVGAGLAFLTSPWGADRGGRAPQSAFRAR